MTFYDRISALSDSVVSVFNPQAGLRRAAARASAEHIRAYEAAQKGRRLKNWKTQSTSQNAETVFSLSTLRDRSRDLVRNNPYAKRAIEILSTNVVGVGIQPTPFEDSVDTTAKGPSAAVKKAAAAWRKWAYSTKADAGGQMNFYGVQRLVARSLFESGEVLIRRVKRNNGLGFAPVSLQVLESDFLDHNKNEDLTDGYILQGVEYDKQGVRVAYWLFQSHPGEIIGMRTFESKRVPADEIIHLYKVDRPGQVRGVPFGAASFVRMRDLDQYADAQLVRQQIAACYVAFIQDAAETFSGQSTPYDGAERFEPGMIETLPPGKSITFGSPPRADGYESYTRTILREIAVAYGVTYEALTADFSNVNFSSARMAWIEFGRLVEELQELVVIPMMLNRVWEWFVDASMVAGLIRKPIGANWTSPKRVAVDPLKEVAALKEMVRAGFISWQEAVRQGGYDPAEVAKEISDDQATFDDNGFMLTVDARNDVARKAPFAIPNAVEAAPKENAEGFSTP